MPRCPPLTCIVWMSGQLEVRGRALEAETYVVDGCAGEREDDGAGDGVSVHGSKDVGCHVRWCGEGGVGGGIDGRVGGSVGKRGTPGKISWGSRFRVQLLVGCDLEVGRLASPQLQTCRNAESHGKSRVFPEPLFRRTSTVSSLSIEDTSTSCGTPLTRTLDTTHILIDYTMRPSQILRVGGPKARPPRHSNPPHAYPKLTPSIETRPIPR